jgi:glutamate-1-semialdehyde aminotransferase
MQSDTFVDVAASVAVVTAAAGLLYARSSARAAHLAVDATRRTVELAERSRQAADRARLRVRVERIGELVQTLAASSQVDSGTDELSERTRGQCSVLTRALIGLKDVLPRSVELGQARTSSEITERSARATVEIDGLLKKLTVHRRRSVYLPRQRVPWERPARAR